MILLNDDYVELGLDSAVRQNSMILEQDKGRWFYKKWDGLSDRRGKEGELERRLEGHLKWRRIGRQIPCTTH